MLPETTRGVSQLFPRAWDTYHRAEEEGLAFVVRPSIPVLFFGDGEQYFASPFKVITVGLNPSHIEFPREDSFARFPAARDLYPEILNGQGYATYLTALNDYFRVDPYSDWFKGSFEELLQGMGASYYDGAESMALHTDLCSPLATQPTWSRLTRWEKAALAPGGIALWHELVAVLGPDVIVVSVARDNLERVRFPRLGEWRDIHTVERTNPYRVQALSLDVAPGRPTLLVFGRAANTPFGTVSHREKRRIGEAVRTIHAGG